MSRLTLRPARLHPADVVALAVEKLDGVRAAFASSSSSSRRRRPGLSRDVVATLQAGVDKAGLWAAYAISGAVYLAVIAAIFYV